MNIVGITGRLSKDPEVVTLNSGDQIVKFSLAVDAFRKGQQTTDFYDCQAWGKSPAFKAVAEYCKKGRQINVSGQLDQEKWESQNGQPRMRIFIKASNVDLLAKPANQESSSEEEDLDNLFAGARR